MTVEPLPLHEEKNATSTNNSQPRPDAPKVVEGADDQEIEMSLEDWRRLYGALERRNKGMTGFRRLYPL